MTLSGHFRAGGVHQTNVCPKSSNREHKNHIPTYETMAKRFCLLSLFTLQYLLAFGSRSQYLAVPAMSSPTCRFAMNIIQHVGRLVLDTTVIFDR